MMVSGLWLGGTSRDSRMASGTTGFEAMRETILDECQTAFTGCFHAFYPTNHLKWLCLCELLAAADPVCWLFLFLLIWFLGFFSRQRPMFKQFHYCVPPFIHHFSSNKKCHSDVKSVEFTSRKQESVAHKVPNSTRLIQFLNIISKSADSCGTDVLYSLTMLW